MAIWTGFPYSIRTLQAARDRDCLFIQPLLLGKAFRKSGSLSVVSQVVSRCQEEIKLFRNSSPLGSLRAPLTFERPLPLSGSVPGTFHCAGRLCHRLCGLSVPHAFKISFMAVKKEKIKENGTYRTSKIQRASLSRRHLCIWGSILPVQMASPRALKYSVAPAKYGFLIKPPLPLSPLLHITIILQVKKSP